MKLIIIGGHLAPALAVIEALPKDTDILFIGRKHTLEGDEALSLEYQKVNSLGIAFKSIETGRLQRKLTRHTIPSIAKLPLGLIQAKNILTDFKPDVVLGFGGYLQIPVAYAAFKQKIPIILHEQTLKAGLANKIVGKFATKICISWQSSAKFFPPNKIILTGNPLRKEFFTSQISNSYLSPVALAKGDPLLPTHYSKPPVPSLYITGGSAGSHAINLLVEACLEKLLETFTITHQTGDTRQFGDFERLEKKKNQLPKQLQKGYNLVKFIDPGKVAQILSEADIVVSRSGMNTICELLYLGKPCLLIPLPHGQNNEQLDNAMFMKSMGLGVVAKQESLTPEMFYSQITLILAKLDKYETYAKEAKKLITEDAASKIAEIILNEGQNNPKIAQTGKK